LIGRNIGLVFKGSGFYCTDYRSPNSSSSTNSSSCSTCSSSDCSSCSGGSSS